MQVFCKISIKFTLYLYGTVGIILGVGSTSRLAAGKSVTSF